MFSSSGIFSHYGSFALHAASASYSCMQPTTHSKKISAKEQINQQLQLLLLLLMLLLVTAAAVVAAAIEAVAAAAVVVVAPAVAEENMQCISLKGLFVCFLFVVAFKYPTNQKHVFGNIPGSENGHFAFCPMGNLTAENREVIWDISGYRCSPKFDLSMFPIINREGPRN